MSTTSSSIGTIRNPLTVIAIFAGLAEVSAVIALPQLPENVQYFFVWFVMLFPVFLVGLFFGTLWFKHQVLYAPSDFKNEENFMKHWVPSPPEQNIDDNEVEVEETASDQSTEPISGKDGSSQDTKDTSGAKGPTGQHRSRYLEIRQAEDLAIKKLSRDMNLSFLRDVALQGVPGVRFDAIAEGPSGPVMVEVVRVFSSSRFIDVTRRALTRVSSVVSGLPNDLRKNSQLIFVVVVDEVPDEDSLAVMGREIDRIPMSVPLRTEIMSYKTISRE